MKHGQIFVKLTLITIPIQFLLTQSWPARSSDAILITSALIQPQSKPSRRTMMNGELSWIWLALRTTHRRAPCVRHDDDAPTGAVRHDDTRWSGFFYTVSIDLILETRQHQKKKVPPSDDEITTAVFPGDAQLCSISPDNFRSEISFSRTCSISNLISYTYHKTLLSLETLYWLSACLVAQMHANLNKHLLIVKFS